ncbi:MULTISPECIES: lysylphosphatidylglycerol synthase domain-containing protein [unclassified Coleofasciculus]|uniref:lysylphosphatidylglycerol synthase domain-containing protein n=1 Tax=unclassified Coleofasciculus TaxID=2692782 RepID=UPI00187EF8B9|nr:MULTISPECIES: lysylphosphatidylglycerol synthase domain-containing protein [unclassified Coleofasciculus]MBE9125688.1 UPF0104 family protein [Coleofasciculus sp. LEGE 07081]MBE9148299.1 UPF0104 family protein [Coleofasciculus sp. LEGE 07092]
MNRRFSPLGLPLLGLLLFSLSLWVIHKELRNYHYSDVLNSLAGIPKGNLVLALAFTILSYLVLTSYDLLAFRYLRRPITKGFIVFTAFISYAVSNSVGFAILTASTIRYRLYSAWGISAGAITQIIAFGNLSFWLGLFAVSGVVFLIEPLVIPDLLHLPIVSLQPIGLIFLLVDGTYLLGCLLSRRQFRISRWVFSLPSPKLAISQIGVSALDWALASAVLYVLLSHTILLSYPSFFSIYVLAVTAGVVSHVPGGLGVFETVILLLLGSKVPAATVLGALLVYRIIYFLLPLIVAVGLLGLYELHQRLKEK